MGEVIRLKTPTGGTSSIGVERVGGHVRLSFTRDLGDGMVKSELLLMLAVEQARETALAVLAAAENGERK